MLHIRFIHSLYVSLKVSLNKYQKILYSFISLFFSSFLVNVLVLFSFSLNADCMVQVIGTEGIIKVTVTEGVGGIGDHF